MKILAFADTHGSLSAIEKLKKRAENADLVVCAGDITIFENYIEKIVKKLDSFKKPVLIIPGNHESEEVLKAVCKNKMNVHYIHKKHYETGDLIFLGFGTGGFSLVEPEFEEIAKKKFSKIISKRKKKKIILVTHASPHRTRVDFIMNDHVGNKSIRKFIEENDVKFHICGHIHETSGQQDKIKETVVINPGPKGKVIKV